MLIRGLSIQNFALIRQFDFNFDTGLHLLSGESGAGKSLIFDAMHLLAGQKSDAVWVRQGASKADLIAELELCERWLQTPLYHQLVDDCLIDEDNPSSLVLRRIIQKDGRSKAQINGIPVKASLLKQVSDELFVFHDQHEGMLLLKKDRQLKWLDQFIGQDDLLKTYSAAFNTWQELAKEKKALEAAHAAAQQRKDYLDYQLKEFADIDLTLSSIQQLESIVKAQDHDARWCAQAEQLSQLLGDDNQFTTLTQQWVNEIQHDKDPHPACLAACQVLETALIHLNEAQLEITQVFDREYLDEDQVVGAQEQLDKVYSLARKHHVLVEELETFKTDIQVEVDSIGSNEERLQLLEIELVAAHQALTELAQQLTLVRQAHAPKLATLLSKALEELGMKNSKWQLEISPRDEFGPKGADNIQFLMSSNKGHELQPLQKIASGGELSRISFVLHVFAQHGGNEASPDKIYFFDEVDVGVSGQVASSIGRHLRRLAQNQQVFCISHAPQVAAQPAVHWYADKSTQHSPDGTAESQWQQLTGQARKNEIARMLGTASEQELALAKKLLSHEREYSIEAKPVKKVKPKTKKSAAESAS